MAVGPGELGLLVFGVGDGDDVAKAVIALGGDFAERVGLLTCQPKSL